VSLNAVVSRGMWGRLGQRPIEGDSTSGKAQVGAQETGGFDAAEPGVRLPGASMRFLETGLALVAIATAILIGAGH
jgi:hypothetical protein